jgi:transcriptional regulator with XRE-family HTH domain
MGMAERIKERRKIMGYTQTELGEKLGLQASAIAKYENGRVENIKRSIIADMARVLECSPCYLLDWEKEQIESKTYPKIVQYYEQLNDIGKHEAEKRVEELTHLPKYTKEGENENNTEEFSKELILTKDYLLPNAAHADESLTEITEEMIQAEEDIMDNENF